MTSGGNNFNYSIENQLTKFNTGLSNSEIGIQKFMYFPVTGGAYAPYAPCMSTPLFTARLRQRYSSYELGFSEDLASSRQGN